MPTFRTGVVIAVVERRPGLQRLSVRVGDAERKAVLYDRWAAPAAPGDRVVVNTTAVDLALGTGGDDFVVWNLAHDSHESMSAGHIMKLRYTPAQSDVLTADEHGESLDGMPVVAASLHSQVIPVVAGIRSCLPQARIAYVMTDGGALEASLSDAVAWLRSAGIPIVTCGHAIGGDLEAVNVYSGLLAAKHVGGAEVIVAGMGPGVVGTGTRFGTTALDLGLTINAAASLGGRPVACVRMSSADPRERHRGVSHHARTALRHVALVPADVVVPRAHAEPIAPHRVVEIETAGVLGLLDELPVRHMGRTPSEDPLFFEAAVAAGVHAASLL